LVLDLVLDLCLDLDLVSVSLIFRKIAVLTPDVKTKVTNASFDQHLPDFTTKYNRPLKEMELWRLVHTQNGHKKMSKALLTLIYGFFFTSLISHL
jgi:hypothetical protein